MADPTNAALVMQVGELLYGTTAVDRLSRDLPMAKRTVERIAASANAGEEYPAARAALEEIPRLINARVRDLEAWKAAAIAQAERQPRRPKPDFAALAQQINGDAGPVIRTPRLDD